MGNTTLDINAVRARSMSSGVGVSAERKYHPSFYGPGDVTRVEDFVDEREDHDDARVNVVQRRATAVVSTRPVRERRSYEQDSRRPDGANFAHRSRVGVSRAEHAVAVDDVSWKTMLVGAAYTAMAVLTLVGIGALASGGPSGSADATGVVRVAEGETLSDIAGKVAPGRAVGAVIEDIMDLNAMSSSGIDVGQTLIVPIAHQG